MAAINRRTGEAVYVSWQPDGGEAVQINQDGLTFSIDISVETKDITSGNASSKTSAAMREGAEGSIVIFDAKQSFKSDLRPGIEGVMTVLPYGAGTAYDKLEFRAMLISYSEEFPFDKLREIDISFAKQGEFLTPLANEYIPTTYPLHAPAPACGAELLTNPGSPFAFAGDDPVGWGITGESGSDPEISEVDSGQGHGGTNVTGGYCNIFTSTSALISMSQAGVMSVGDWYSAFTEVDTVAAGYIKIESGLAPFALFNSDYATAFRAVSSGFIVKRAVACDITISQTGLSLLSNTLLGVDTGSPHQTVQAELTLPGFYPAGVWSDGDDAAAPDNYLLAYYNRNNSKVYVEKYLGGSFDSELSATAATYVAGAELKIVAVGDDREIWYNSVLLTTETLTNSTLLDGTCAGLFSTSCANEVTFNNAEATALPGDNVNHWRWDTVTRSELGQSTILK